MHTALVRHLYISGGTIYDCIATERTRINTLLPTSWKKICFETTKIWITGIDKRCFQPGKVEASGRQARQTATLRKLFDVRLQFLIDGFLENAVPRCPAEGSVSFTSPLLLMLLQLLTPYLGISTVEFPCGGLSVFKNF
uniref:Uncharacterized protein n=1 Tax=Trichuris muris TaxID=70415 RepID=A0A5S6Q5P9_TRIMR